MNDPHLPESHKITPPTQTQNLPGSQDAMLPRPLDEDLEYQPAERLRDKVVLITGGDSGIGRSVALLLAKEGAAICLLYLNEHEDARKTAERISQRGGKVIAFAGDVGEPSFCERCVQETIAALDGWMFSSTTPVSRRRSKGWKIWCRNGWSGFFARIFSAISTWPRLPSPT